MNERDPAAIRARVEGLDEAAAVSRLVELSSELNHHSYLYHVLDAARLPFASARMGSPSPGLGLALSGSTAQLGPLSLPLRDASMGELGSHDCLTR